MTEQVEQGVVAALRGRLFEVLADDGRRVRCEVRQKVKTDADNTTPVAVGDNVEFTRTDDDSSGVIEQVKGRRSAFFRPQVGMEHNKQVIAANLDRLAIIVSVASPPLKPGLIDRCIIAARCGSMEPIIVINKIDLNGDEQLEDVLRDYASAGFVILTVSADTQQGLDKLRLELAGHRTLFAGHSGVGKSSLLNKLIPGVNIRTQEVSDYSDKGKHTTSYVELYELPTGGIVVDSPGLKLMSLWQVGRDELADYYPEFEEYREDCRFQPCSHIHEPGCAIKAALKAGHLSGIRYDNYVTIYNSL